MPSTTAIHTREWTYKRYSVTVLCEHVECQVNLDEIGCEARETAQAEGSENQHFHVSLSMCHRHRWSRSVQNEQALLWG